ncbi:hypothetical protein LCGC14_2938250 [marine sediment metagenome]|uniref:Uncharacterized protein n=1 Tax=marine sediment metagenome TaxID=412755 RepID=A0A0F8XJD9_9ZZZZ
MNAKFGAFIVFMLALMAGSLTIKEIEKRTPVEEFTLQESGIEGVKPAPKQSPYVIYIYVCDQLEAVIVTSEPYMSSDMYHDDGPTAKMLVLIFEAESAGRILTFNGGLRFCPEPEII